MATITPETLLEQLHWRYATKQFDAQRKIPAQVWSALEQSLILTPSSYGMQPWKFVVLNKDAELRERLVSCSWGQRQVADSSHYVVFTVRTEITEQDVDTYMDSIAATRQIDKSAVEPLKKMIESGIVRGLNATQQQEWASRQAYIALGNFMTSAALLGIDTCPMEGLDPAKYDEVLGLKGSGYATCVACAAGYRAASDKYSQLAKVRYTAQQVVENR
ncbi:MAG: NAD(P)H-dependent oxidoreductase [Planctomycetota bacterium]|nr:MAG: NAD(P)H-dependent oxidoreductase [Planctomycetota bacterium]